MTTIDKHNAETLRAIADGKPLQYKNIANTWIDVQPETVLIWMGQKPSHLFEANRALLSIRVKPSTIRIGDYDVPEPMRVAPEEGTTYYFVHLDKFDNYDYHDWDGGVFDTNMLSKGICHLTKEAADIHAAALLSLTA